MTSIASAAILGENAGSARVADRRANAQATEASAPERRQALTERTRQVVSLLQASRLTDASVLCQETWENFTDYADSRITGRAFYRAWATAARRSGDYRACAALEASSLLDLPEFEKNDPIQSANALSGLAFSLEALGLDDPFAAPSIGAARAGATQLLGTQPSKLNHFESTSTPPGMQRLFVREAIRMGLMLSSAGPALSLRRRATETADLFRLLEY